MAFNIRNITYWSGASVTPLSALGYIAEQAFQSYLPGVFGMIPWGGFFILGAGIWIGYWIYDQSTAAPRYRLPKFLEEKMAVSINMPSRFEDVKINGQKYRALIPKIIIRKNIGKMSISISVDSLNSVLGGDLFWDNCGEHLIKSFDGDSPTNIKEPIFYYHRHKIDSNSPNMRTDRYIASSDGWVLFTGRHDFYRLTLNVRTPKGVKSKKIMICDQGGAGGIPFVIDFHELEKIMLAANSIEEAAR